MLEYLEIGQIVNTQGLKGVMKVNPFTDDVTRFERLKTVYIEKKKELTEREIESVSYGKKQVLLKLKGIDTIEQAESYKECYVKIHKKDAVVLPEDTYFIADLMEMEVYTDENILLGKIVDIFPTGSNDVYVVKDQEGKQILLPAIADVVKQVDLENRKVVVTILKRTIVGGEMKFDVLTLFPEMFDSLKTSILGRAVEKDLITIQVTNIRDFSKDKHKKVDDTPYGGGAGMVMKPDVVYDAYQSVKGKNSKVIYLSPQGTPLSQKKVESLAKESHLILLCGHYEGIDQRVLEEIKVEEISIGDYVLTRRGNPSYGFS